MAQFDKQSIERIIRSVIKTERLIGTWPVRGKRDRNYPWNSTTILYALVNEASGVDSGDATFDVDNVECLSGIFSATSIADVRNGQGAADRQVYCDNAPVLLAWNGTDSEWDVLWNGTARNLRATINEGAGVSGGAFDVDNIVAKDGYWDASSTSGDAVTNPFSMDGDDDGVVWIFVCDDGALECIQMECPA